MHVSLSRSEFKKRALRGNVIPVYRQLLGDAFTPITIFLRMSGDVVPNSFLLESVVNNEQIGRNSFLGVSARAILRGEKGSFRITQAGGRTEKAFNGDPLRFLEDAFRGLKPVPDPRLPHFYGGAVGFLAYDAIRYYEKIPDKNPDPIGQEDAYFILCDELVIFDHIEHHVRLVVNVRTEEHADLDKAYDHALERIGAMETSVQGPDRLFPPQIATGKLQIESNMSAEEYQEMVVKARKYIHAGDIFQVVLSKRFSFRPGVSPFQIYRGLRSINPSPYMFYVNAGPYSIIGSSPEILVRLQDGKVTIRPIAGTRRRGQTPEEDSALEKELLSDSKEIAEHVMLVDLGRNDAGRVSEPGSVRVTEFKVIERYSHVMHIVSNCEGDLRKDLSGFDALRYALPAGTVSGAPKIRAMEIIDELENVRRGIYAGCLGYFTYAGDYDTAISIRTMIVKDGVCHAQSGAGIVFDSDPVKECEEVANKVRGLIAAVRFARRGLEWR